MSRKFRNMKAWQRTEHLSIMLNTFFFSMWCSTFRCSLLPKYTYHIYSWRNMIKTTRAMISLSQVQWFHSVQEILVLRSHISKKNYQTPLLQFKASTAHFGTYPKSWMNPLMDLWELPSKTINLRLWHFSFITACRYIIEAHSHLPGKKERKALLILCFTSSCIHTQNNKKICFNFEKWWKNAWIVDPKRSP